MKKNNSDLDEKLSRFSKIESRIYDKYINKMSSKVNKLLDEKNSTDCGLIHIKNKNVLDRIDLLTGNPTVINYFETDNEYVSYELLSLGDAFYKEIDDLWNDKTFIELGNELNKISNNL